MAEANFEEKEFEFPLYRELLASEYDVWTPGQVLEGHLGFDGALRVAEDYWEVVDRDAVPGVNLARYGLSPILARPGDLPDFTTNLFLQVKRPFEYTKAPTKVQAQGLGAPSWYFKTRQHQQLLLERLASHIGDRAEVAYASPAFADKRRLFNLMRERALRHNTTFPAASQLSGHGAWHYDEGGSEGVAMSEPERVAGPSLPARLNRIRQPGSGSGRWHQVSERKGESAMIPPEQEERVTRNLLAATTLVDEVLDEAGSPLADRVRAQVEGSLRRASAHRRDCQRLALKLALATTYMGTSWLVVGSLETK